MELLDKFSVYMKDNLDVMVEGISEKALTLPFYLLDAYRFYGCKIESKHYLLVVPKILVEIRPSDLKKHIDQIINSYPDILPILVIEQVASFIRKRLIQQKISFVVPGNQMYLPNLGLDLREYFKKQITQPNSLSPVAQLVFLYLLINKDIEKTNPTVLAEKLGYSTMSMSRTINELSSLELIREEKTGRQRWFELNGDRRILWNKAKNFLMTPVKYAPFVEADYLPPTDKPYLHTGESALAELSMLNPPDYNSIAMSQVDWKVVKEKKSASDWEKIIPSGNKVQVEVWSYDPRLLSQSRTVDPFSLFLSLNYLTDERVKAALENLFEDYAW